jgi:hypothetical protein
VTDDIARAQKLVEGVLGDLGFAGAGWRVRSVQLAENLLPPPRPGLDLGVHLRIEAGPESDRATSVHVHFTASVPHDQACFATADQLQDELLELTQGLPVPECPGHQHPAVARLLDSGPTWVCPNDDKHCPRAVSGA